MVAEQAAKIVREWGLKSFTNGSFRLAADLPGKGADGVQFPEFLSLAVPRSRPENPKRTAPTRKPKSSRGRSAARARRWPRSWPSPSGRRTLYAMIATLDSAVRYWTGRGGLWKGRVQDVGPF